MSIAMPQQDRERLEREFWRNDPHERPGAWSLDSLVGKMAEVPIFTAEVKEFSDSFARAKDVLELGGGQLWASCIVKALHPDACVTGSDISADAVVSAVIWEEIFRVQLDGKIECTSYAIPFPDRSLDLIFAFQAAHHFGDHRATLAEARRVLRPGGSLLYLGEPVCSKLTYPMAFRRVNRIRPVVQEDLLILGDMRRLADEHGFKLDLSPRSEIIHPTLKKLVYYSVLDAVPALRRVVPSAMSLRFSLPN